MTESQAGSNKSLDQDIGSEMGSVGKKTIEAVQLSGQLDAGLGTWEKEELRMNAGLG